MKQSLREEIAHNIIKNGHHANYGVIDIVFATLKERIEDEKQKIKKEVVDKESEGWHDAGARSALDTITRFLE